ncbi:MAG: hypothetical protein ACOCZU_00465 [Planctomycetota bacterium]
MCPFLNASDPRCSAHLTLKNIQTALAHCADRYMQCPVYQAMIGQTTNGIAAPEQLKAAS